MKINLKRPALVTVPIVQRTVDDEGRTESGGQATVRLLGRADREEVSRSLARLQAAEESRPAEERSLAGSSPEHLEAVRAWSVDLLRRTVAAFVEVDGAEDLDALIVGLDDHDLLIPFAVRVLQAQTPDLDAVFS